MTSLFKNGKIHTVDTACETADALVVKNGRFAFVGSLSDAGDYLRATGPADVEIDLRGRFVLPAFNDSHMHFLHYAKSFRSVQLVGSKSIGEIRERIRAGLVKRSPDDRSWLEGEGWNQDLFVDEKRFPNKFDLDDLTDNIPVLIMRNCYHIGVLNSAAMRAVGLTRDTAPVYGNLAELLPDGEPNGVIKEGLLDGVKAEISTLTGDLIETIAEAAQYRAFAQGITSVQTDDIGYMPDSDYDLFFKTLGNMEAAGKLLIDIGEQCLIQKAEKIQEFFDKGYRRGAGGKKYRVNCIKLLSDGSLGARTAALRTPYADCPETKGVATFSQEELDGLVAAAHRNRCPVAIHAIGDLAIEMSLDAIGRAQKAYPDIRLRDGIVHCQITDKTLIDRFAELNVTAFVQPIFIDYDMNIVEDRVGPALAATSYAWKSMLGKGVRVAFGTDCPVEPFDTMPNLYTAVSRKNVTTGSVGRKVFLPQERMTMKEALRAYTLESAYAGGQEKERGSITAGKTADFIVLDRDLLNIRSDEEILNTHVLCTYVNGEPVYRA